MSGRSNCRRKRTAVRCGGAGIAVLAGILAVGTAWAGGSGSCVSVVVDAPIQLPGGGVYPSGTLTLCETLGYSPVATLHRTEVNGQPVGLLLSRKRTSESAPTADPTVFFRRTEDGWLELVGYVVPARDRNVTFLLNTSPEPRRGPAETGPLLALAAR